MHVKYKEKGIYQRRAQTASELAIFGAILISVIGLIIRFSLSANYNQRKSLVALQKALRLSYETSATGDHGMRNTAAILFVEDRKNLNPNSKFGIQDRTPHVAIGTAAFSRNLFVGVKYPGKPSDRGSGGHEWVNDHFYSGYLPVMDIEINGKNFVFTSAAFVVHKVLFSSPGAVGFRGDWQDDENDRPYGTRIIRDCFKPKKYRPMEDCLVLYTKVPNGNTSPKYEAVCDNCDDRFDLDRSGYMGAPQPDVPEADRLNFGWQWYPITAVSTSIDLSKNKNTILDVDGDLKEESVLVMRTEGSCDGEGNSCWCWPDVTKCEVSYNEEGKYSSEKRSIQWFNVIDYQEGDFDFTFTKNEYASGFPKPGLQPELNAYSITNDGTSLRIEEGKLYEAGGDSKQYIRNTQRTDKVDYIERIIQLSNNTGNFCTLAGNNPNSAVNPEVKACAEFQGDCYSPDKIESTCYDKDAITTPAGTFPRLYVRSRITDKKARIWITDTDDDEMLLK